MSEINNLMYFLNSIKDHYHLRMKMILERKSVKIKTSGLKSKN